MYLQPWNPTHCQAPQASALNTLLNFCHPKFPQISPFPPQQTLPSYISGSLVAPHFTIISQCETTGRLRLDPEGWSSLTSEEPTSSLSFAFLTKYPDVLTMLINRGNSQALLLQVQDSRSSVLPPPPLSPILHKSPTNCSLLPLIPSYLCHNPSSSKQPEWPFEITTQVRPSLLQNPQWPPIFTENEFSAHPIPPAVSWEWGSTACALVSHRIPSGLGQLQPHGLPLAWSARRTSTPSLNTPLAHTHTSPIPVGPIIPFCKTIFIALCHAQKLPCDCLWFYRFYSVSLHLPDCKFRWSQGLASGSLLSIHVLKRGLEHEGASQTTCWKTTEMERVTVFQVYFFSPIYQP